MFSGKVWKMEEYFVYPQGVCHIRKPASLATAVLYFPFFKPQTGGKRSAIQPQTIYSEFPQIPRDFITSFRAVFMGSLSGSFAEGSPSQSQR